MHRDVEQILFPSSGVASFLSCDLFLLVFPSVLPSPATSLPSAPHILRLEKLKEVIYCPVQTGLHLLTSHLEVIFPLVVLSCCTTPLAKPRRWAGMRDVPGIPARSSLWSLLRTRLGIVEKEGERGLG